MYDERGGGGLRRATLAGLASAGPASRVLWGSSDMKVRQTVAAMRHVALQALRDPQVSEIAIDIVRSAPPRDAAAQIAAVRAWLAAHVRFMADPLIDGDVIRTPALLLGQLRRSGEIRGDCDDIATLAAALLHSIGVPARFRVVAFGPGDRPPYRHVFTEAMDQAGRWHQLDVTETPERREAVAIRRTEAFDVLPGTSSGVPALAGLAGLVGLIDTVIVGGRAIQAVRELLAEVGVDV